MILYKKIAIILLALTAVVLPSCVEEKPESLENLCSGYWILPADEAAPLLRFGENGGVSYYKWRYSLSEDEYYICRDTSSSDEYNSYLLDSENDMLCILPDKWYYVLLLTEERMVLDEGGETQYIFDNIEDDDVEVLSAEEFRRRFPEDAD